MKKKLNLPQDYVDFMESDGVLKYDHKKTEPGLVGLTPLHELELGEVWVNSDGSPLKSTDPHAGEDGFYTVPAVSLTNECEAYDPEYILLWLPNEELYGTWDCDHWDLFVFNDTTWRNIVENPAKYIDAQWGDTKHKVGVYFAPFPKYEFKTGMPFLFQASDYHAVNRSRRQRFF